MNSTFNLRINPFKFWSIVLLVLWIIVALSSCNPAKRLSKICQNCPEKIKDSISYVETIERDTIFKKLPGDTTIIEVPVDLPDYKLIEENTKQKITIEILKGKLSVQSICKEDSLELVIAELRTEKTDQETIIKYVDKPVSVKFIPKWVKILAWIGVGSIILLIVVVYVKIKNKGLKTLLNRLK